MFGRRHGFADERDYWDRSSSAQFLPAIRRPTLLINALNDPFMPASALPRTPENLRACRRCDQLIGLDVSGQLALTDIFVIASANPEDYTNRGRIITPLKDRFGSQIRTHYPRRVEDEIAIMESERTAYADVGLETKSPEFMKQLVAEDYDLDEKQKSIVLTEDGTESFNVFEHNFAMRSEGSGDFAPRPFSSM